MVTDKVIYITKIVALASAILVICVQEMQAQTGLPKPFVVQLSDTTHDYQRVFAGPPQTKSMHSGLVVLAPAKSVGKHSTKSYEEAIVVLSGVGQFNVSGGPSLQLNPNCVVYCPPGKEHDVVNTGSTPLRYLYIAAKPGK